MPQEHDPKDAASELLAVPYTESVILRRGGRVSRGRSSAKDLDREERTMRRKVLALLAASTLWAGLAASPALASGSGSTSRNGLTCDYSWGHTGGSATCRGRSNQKWRLKLRCAFQGDITKSWHEGPGNDAGECNFRIQSSEIIWG
jgi:hypothetical protein